MNHHRRQLTERQAMKFVLKPKGEQKLTWLKFADKNWKAIKEKMVVKNNGGGSYSYE